ncbi:MAG TPA: YceI family protein [Caulobacteraceae bacterium]|jgi:polyisoprenoid-binding protein YceI|nr:YceI family protein [Caulobacteraceae bacterium]
MRRPTTVLAFAAVLAALVACSQKPAPTAPGAAAPAAAAVAAQKTAPAGDYVTDPAHSSLTFTIDHLGFSHWTGRFEKWSANLHFDPKDVSKMSVSATIDARSLAHDNPPAGFLAELTGPHFLDADNYPQMSFHSTKVVQTGPDSADVTGDLTLHGVTRPVTLKIVYNGGYPGMSLDPKARVGFSAHGSLNRSDFGVSMGLPPAGTTFGVGDRVDIAIETELVGPPLVAAQGASATPPKP